jgi:hypothetical protein
MDDATTAKALLDAANLAPPEDDAAALVASHVRIQELVALLFAVPHEEEMSGERP